MKKTFLLFIALIMGIFFISGISLKKDAVTKVSAIDGAWEKIQ